MAIDRTGITSLNAGAGEITYSGNQGPKSPDQQLMAQADPMVVEMYQRYVFEMEEQGMQPVSFRKFLQQIMAESRMAKGGRAGYQGGQLVRPPGITDEEWYRIMYGIKGPRPLSSQSPYLSVHGDGGRAGYQLGGGADRMPTEPRTMGNPPVMEEIENMREFRLANPNIEDVADYKGYYERLKKLKELQRLMGKGMAYGGTAKPTYTQSRKQQLAGGGIAGLKQIGKPGGRVEPGIMKYGAWDWIKEKADDLIPNELKKIIPNELKSPLGAVVAGSLLDRYGIPGTWRLTDSGDNFGRDWLEGLTNITEGIPVLGPVAKGVQKVGETIGGIPDSIGNIITGGDGFQMSDILSIPGRIGDGITSLGGSLGNLIGLDQKRYDEQGRPIVNWKTPLAIGLGAGAAQAAMPKDVMPQDTSGIDIANIRSRALTGSDPNLHFLPPASATTAYAKGGRTGYYAGDRVQQNVFQAFSNYKNAGGKEDFSEWFSDIYLPEAARAQKLEGIASIPKTSEEEDPWALGAPYGFAEPGTIGSPEMISIGKAQGGRIGYAGSGNGNRYSYLVDKYNKGIPLTPNEIKELEMLEITYADVDRDPSAQGGRIGYDNGGDVMMASNPSMGDELNQMSLMIFKKPLSELTDDEYEDLQEYIREKSAQGGRIGAQEGGLMDLGGMEKDYRNEGGFVPIGGQERADDVPARLSKNEFVFTADAVRSAGGGDIDKGAEVMENVMEHLEQGGQISQESQGLEGARNMFATAQRLEGVL